MSTPSIILLVDVESELAGRIVPALRNAGYRPLQVHGISETVRVMEQAGSSVALMITEQNSATGAALARIAPRSRVLSIARAGLDFDRMTEAGWVELVRSALESRL